MVEHYQDTYNGHQLTFKSLSEVADDDVRQGKPEATAELDERFHRSFVQKHHCIAYSEKGVDDGAVD